MNCRIFKVTLITGKECNCIYFFKVCLFLCTLIFLKVFLQIDVRVVPYTSGKIWSARLIFLFFLAVCLNISTVINIKILTNSNQQTQSYNFTSHIAAFLSVVLINEMLEICIQTSYHQNVQLILKSTEMLYFMFSRTWLLNEISGIEFKIITVKN